MAERAASACAIVAVLLGATPEVAWAQPPGLSGHYLNLWTRAGSSVLGPAGGSGFQRLRAMWRGGVGPARADFAYEHTLALREAGALGAQFLTAAAGAGGGGDWLSLGGDLHEAEGLHWRHRIDRLNVTFDLGDDADLTVGRQPVSWATTLFLTPADPFSPFDPADPFREYRTGVDAVRLRYYRGAFTQFEVVARPARLGAVGSGDCDETLTLLGRATTSAGGWDVAGWAGLLHDTFGASASVSGSLGLWALRAEAVVRDLEGGLAARGTVGLDRSFVLGGRDLYVVVEVQRDGLGAASADDLLGVATGRAYAQGEMQVLGRHAAAVQLSWQLHPLVSASSLALASLRDGSFLVGPGLSYSVTQSTGLRLGAYAGAGEEATQDGAGLRPRSEYGSVPIFIFLSTSFFF